MARLPPTGQQLGVEPDPVAHLFTVVDAALQFRALGDGLGEWECAENCAIADDADLLQGEVTWPNRASRT